MSCGKIFSRAKDFFFEGLAKYKLVSQKNHHFRERFFSETGAGKHVPRCVMVDLEFGPEKVEQLTGSDG